MVEFTGERVVPGQVAPDLWNEHYARYAFAARLARGKRVLDIGCGTGYGSALLAEVASTVVGADLSPAAAASARGAYDRHNLRFLAAPAQNLPFPSGAFDLIVAFEVIEHLEDWAALLREARRLLSPSGQFIVSTPNKLYYAESRRLHGPNPYHSHEFEYEEFRGALRELFPHVAFFLQNHVQGIAFQPEGAPAQGAQVAVERGDLKPEESHFFLAVCAAVPQTGAPTWVYLPSTANLLREREQHIELLEGELAQKNSWLEKLKTEHAELVEMYRAQKQELVERAEWAEKLDQDLESARTINRKVQEELQETVTGYETKLNEVNAELIERTMEVQATERRLGAELQSRIDELARCVELLHQAEALVEERTRWAQELDARVAELLELMKAASHSRWIRLGRTIGVGPNLGDR